MRHGSHGDACLLCFADYRKRKGTKQPGKTGCLCRSGVERCHGCSARSGPSPTDHDVVFGRLGQPPVPSLPDHSVGRSIWPVRAHGRYVDPFVFCVPDDRDPLHHRVLTVQALLGAFGAARWHGESGTVDLSDQPIRLPHFALEHGRRRSRSRGLSRLVGLWIEGASSSPRFADAVRLNATVPIDTSAGERSESGRPGPSAHDAERWGRRRPQRAHSWF
jgi:hypothetical protein